MRQYKVLVVLIFIFTILTMIAVFWYIWYQRHNAHEGYFYNRSGQTYHGEIYPEQIRTRDQIVHDMQKTTMHFYETNHSFGDISQGSVVRHSFRFKNTGEHPLMIAKTDVTCGCTVPGFPQESISPGQEGEVTIEFNTTGKPIGFEEKSVLIHSNTIPETVALKIDANIK